MPMSAESMTALGTCDGPVGRHAWVWPKRMVSKPRCRSPTFNRSLTLESRLDGNV